MLNNGYAKRILVGLAAGVVFGLSAHAWSQTDTATDETSAEEGAPGDIETELGIPEMQCEEDVISFECVTTYLDEVQVGLDEYVAGRIESIADKLERAENVDEEFEDLMQAVDFVLSQSAEGGPLAEQIDRIGALIESSLDEIHDDPELADLAGRFEEVFGNYRAARAQLTEMRELGRDARELIQSRQRRVEYLLRLQLIEDALEEVTATLEGLTPVVESVKTLADLTRETPDDSPVGVPD